ncbi:hypothetical protein LC040_10690 [Bacillus tianshenii]|nr:hypothetical protein LC040_10690 [Bacillus tianshenii]
MFAVETTIEETELQTARDILDELVTLVDAVDGFYFVQTKDEADVLQAYFETLEQFVDLHPIAHVSYPQSTQITTDYAIMSRTDAYFFADLVAAFKIINGKDEQKEMALYQIEEDLVASAKIDNTKVFFIDKKDKLLIEGYAEAYDIEVSFLHLDKVEKKH